ncbi:MAG: hypothetical protein COC17_01775 [Hyphomicrobiales bacterium]|nr:hypothetical protein [Hyphomicrobiales bacterium]PCH51091.1 MAG: hypothetical protein COC17_02260 [Hyphomicrobiales bacterium]PCH51366.1 MAG: hypothetical protein COC17_01775 [Hyphomicrobiales bacterium]
MNRPTIFGLIAFSSMAIPIFVTAQTHKDHNIHSSMSSNIASKINASTSSSPLTEPGQGAFAAISEVVKVLSADDNTDWSKVNLTNLRDHLIDMDILIRNATATQTTLENGVSTKVTGDAETLATAKRMIPAHGNELRSDKSWVVDFTVNANDVILTVTSEDPKVALRIKALGFYGLMASQDHHREHHYIIAKGGDAHSGH